MNFLKEENMIADQKVKEAKIMHGQVTNSQI